MRILNNSAICLRDWRSHSGPVSGETSLVLTVCRSPIKTRGPPLHARHAAPAAILAQVTANPPGAILAPVTLFRLEYPNISNQIQRFWIILLSTLHRLAEGSLKSRWHQVIGGGEPSWHPSRCINMQPFWNLFWRDRRKTAALIRISVLNKTNSAVWMVYPLDP